MPSLAACQTSLGVGQRTGLCSMHRMSALCPIDSGVNIVYIVQCTTFLYNVRSVSIMTQKNVFGIRSLCSVSMLQNGALAKRPKTPITNAIKLERQKLKHASCIYNTVCNSQPITAYRPIDGISPLTERAPDDRHHGRGAAHYLAFFNFNCSCLLHVVNCSLLVLSFIVVVKGL